MDRYAEYAWLFLDDLRILLDLDRADQWSATRERLNAGIDEAGVYNLPEETTEEE
jgi:hypothetical protein